LIASISALSMISIPSSAPSASKPHDKGAKREQNPERLAYEGGARNPNRLHETDDEAGESTTIICPPREHSYAA
jgi:hypothetical protein